MSRIFLHATLSNIRMIHQWTIMQQIGHPQDMTDARWMKSIARGFLLERAANTHNVIRLSTKASIVSYSKMSPHVSL